MDRMLEVDSVKYHNIMSCTPGCTCSATFTNPMERRSTTALFLPTEVSFGVSFKASIPLSHLNFEARKP